MLLLRLVPLLPFNMMNYLLSVTPVPIAHYMLASWLGMMVCKSAFVIPYSRFHCIKGLIISSLELFCQIAGVTPFEFLHTYVYSFSHVSIHVFFQPITFALVYVGTTLKDLSDVTHGWHEFSKTRLVML